MCSSPSTKGIADIRAYPPEQHAGIVLFRPPSMGRGTTLAFVRPHLPAVLKLDLAGHLVVVRISRYDSGNRAVM